EGGPSGQSKEPRRVLLAVSGRLVFSGRRELLRRFGHQIRLAGFCTTTFVRGSLRNLGRIGDRGTSSGTWPAAWAPTGMVFPDLWEEARKAPEFVEVARPIHQGRAASLVNQRRHPSDPFRELATALPAVAAGEGVAPTPFARDLSD